MSNKIRSLLGIAMKKNIYSTVTLLFLAVLLITESALSLAWLSNFREIDPDLSFTAGSPEDYTLYKITCENDSEVPVVEAVDTIGTNGFLVNDLQLGNISNLGMLENSNFIYYVVRVPKKEGGNVSLGVSYYRTDGNHFKIYVPVKDGNDEITYDDEGKVVTTLYENAEGIAAIKDLETETDTFLSYRVALSSVAPEDMDSIDSLNSLFVGDSMNMNVDEVSGEPIAQTLTHDISALQDEYYYAYIKIEPNVLLFAGFIDYLWQSMPFGLCYDVRITFSVTA